MKHAVYAGSFDPLTLGHEDIIRRGAKVFDRLTIGIGINPDKKPLFSPDERLKLMSEVLGDLDNVNIYCFEGLAVEFVSQQNATIMLRGLRTLTDIESEFTLSLANRSLAPDIETVFLMASEKYSHISSSLIKQIGAMGRNNTEEQLKQFIPVPVISLLIKKLQK